MLHHFLFSAVDFSRSTQRSSSTYWPGSVPRHFRHLSRSFCFNLLQQDAFQSN